MTTVASNAPDDGNWHFLIGKLELNVAGGSNERLTVWLDPTGVETGGTTAQIEADILTNLSELQGTFDGEATNPLDPDDPEKGRTYIDDIAIGTTWQDVLTVDVPRLTLRVNRANNTGKLINNTTTSFGLNSYSIESEAGSLNGTGWNSLDEQNVSNWQQNLATSHQLLESDFQGSTPIGPGGQLSLGGLFTASATEDLTGRYTTTDGLVNLLKVEFVTESVGVTGDYNNDGKVNAADYTVWRNKLNTSATLPNDSTPGTVTVADYNVWKANYGTSAGSGGGGLAGSEVPEPNTAYFALTAIAAIATIHGRRISQG